MVEHRQPNWSSESTVTTLPYASVRDDVRPGVAVMAKGVWLRHHPEGYGINALCDDAGDPLANGACFNDTFVEVTAA